MQNPPQETIKYLISLYNKGQFLFAFQQAKTLTEKYPKSFMIWNILGVSSFQIGILEEAIKSYKQALLLKPNYAEVYNNIGVAFKEQGKIEKAIEAFNKCISIKPDHTAANINIGDALKNIIFETQNPILQNTMISLLDQKTYVRPKNIAKTVISFLKLDPKLKKYLQSNSFVQKISLKNIISDLSELTLLLKLMSVCPVIDIEIEKLLTFIRSRLLLSISSFRGNNEVIKFQSALALQCFNNEYIYIQSEEENKTLENLEMVVRLALNNNEQLSPQYILCLACYKSLNNYAWSSNLIITTEIQEVFNRQVVEPTEETKLRSTIPILKEIKNVVSSQVKEQYEAKPYPRWINLGLPFKPETIFKVINDMNLKIFDDRIKEVNTPSILIAGCGTGQHSIETTSRFKDSKVLGIDLSMSSLSYAKRKSIELNIQNIDYMQADILDLGKLDKQFDIIECVGVLHHMSEPVEGWKALRNCLKPGGLMKIGLYSELAREDIVKIRKEISNKSFGSSDSELKSFRNKLINSDNNHYKLILNSYDFYSLSAVKDLLFHEKEHRFTIDQIQKCLSQLELRFCGFEDKKIVSEFKQTNANMEDCYVLDKWKIYEEANPQVFSGMYQFWCQKM